MAVTRLERKGKRNKSRAKNRVSKIKQLNAMPTIKNVDIEEIKKSFEAAPKPAKKAEAKKEEAPEVKAEAPVKEKKAAAPKAEAKEAKPKKAPTKKKDTEDKKED
ncbi:hypothetical protein [Marinoscillum sp.]|uniref:hypothetical protein n=1 Tax=Marinoscillum sp. TaxID=2024838 RepID=UPI003BA877DF